MEEYEEAQEDEGDDIRKELKRPGKKEIREVPREVPKPKAEVTSTSIVTQTQPAFKLPDGEVVTLEGLLLWMANEVLKIRRAVA